jgi:hypothetical protein
MACIRMDDWVVGGGYFLERAVVGIISWKLGWWGKTMSPHALPR